VVRVNPGRSSEDLKIEILDSPRGARIMKLAGPLTLKTLFDFQHASREQTSHSIIMDISAVPYMDSAGLGSLISVFASCQRTSRGFAIIGISDRIRTLFEVTHCDGLLPCFDSLGAAEIAAIKTS
jgi:anti-sigma B factor antagonist